MYKLQRLSCELAAILNSDRKQRSWVPYKGTKLTEEIFADRTEDDDAKTFMQKCALAYQAK